MTHWQYGGCGGVRPTPTEHDRRLLFTATEPARARKARGLRLNASEATALVADVGGEAAATGPARRVVERACPLLGPADVLPGVPDVVTGVHVEAVFKENLRVPHGQRGWRHPRRRRGHRTPHRDGPTRPRAQPDVDEGTGRRRDPRPPRHHQGHLAPPRTDRRPPAQRLRHPRPRINHYLCNGGVVLCAFGDDERDEAAAAIFRDLLPDRDVVVVDARTIFASGGGIHCITRQQPKA